MPFAGGSGEFGEELLAKGPYITGMTPIIHNNSLPQRNSNTMSMKRNNPCHRSIHDIVAQIQDLSDTLAQLLLEEEAAEDAANPQLPVQDTLIGARVCITHGTNHGHEGEVTHRHGKDGTDYWYIRLDDGREVYKIRHHFHRLD